MPRDFDVQREKKLSADVFDAVGFPFLRRCCPYLINHELLSVETVPHRFARMMDMIAGVDALVLAPGYITQFSIGVRVQYGKAYDTHTLRVARDTGKPVEWQHALAAYLDPNKLAARVALTIQIYVSHRSRKADLLSCGVVKTEEYVPYVQHLLRAGQRLPIRQAIDLGDNSKSWFTYFQWPIPVPSFWSWKAGAAQQTLFDEY